MDRAAIRVGGKPSLDYALSEQSRAAKEYIETGHPLAELGMGDWFAESFLMEMERREAMTKDCK